MNEELLYRLALTFVKEVGPVTGRMLIEQYGSAVAMFKAPLKELKHISGLTEQRVKGFRGEEVIQRAEQELTYIDKQHIQTVWIAYVL
jgi:DNA processing protein